MSKKFEYFSNYSVIPSHSSSFFSFRILANKAIAVLRVALISSEFFLNTKHTMFSKSFNLCLSLSSLSLVEEETCCLASRDSERAQYWTINYSLKLLRNF